MKLLVIKLFKILGIIFVVLVGLLLGLYYTKLRYPNIKKTPKEGKWYRVSSKEMKTSEGNSYHAFFKKGSENKVLIYFAGGGVSVNEATARNDTYNTKQLWPDIASNLTMNMGGLATAGEDNPFKDWTVIAFPYATGDFHCGTGEFKYTDKDGKEKILYHNGYNNFTATMERVMDDAGIESAESVVVTGYSAGGWGASILAEDVFTKYFPNATSKTVMVDASLGLYPDWKDVAEHVWKAPEHICARIKSDNLTLDCLTALHDDFGDGVTILFVCSTRDGDLSKVQRYFNDMVIDESNGEMPLEEKDADAFEIILTDFVMKLKEGTGASVYIYNGKQWYDDPRNFTMHTIIATPDVHADLNQNGCSVAQWLSNAVEGKKEDNGLELLKNQ